MQYTISYQYAHAILNNDKSALCASDNQHLSNFLKGKQGHFVPVKDMIDIDWNICEVDGSWSDCVTLLLIPIN